MIITIKNGADEKQLDKLVDWIARQGASADVETAGGKLLVGILSGVENIDEELLKSMDIVEKVTRVTEKYKLTNRKFHPEDTVVTAGGKKIGGENYTFIAGPCSVESEKQIIGIAKAVKKAGAAILRGGAFKPRTSPYDFQGLKSEGIKLLKKAKAETGMPIITEIAGVKNIDDFDGVDIIQIGARNMQNFELLKEMGKQKKPILLKRGLASTIKEWLMSAEYIMSEGNQNIILCERGIRTFDTYSRNTLDLTAVPMLHELTHLPVVVDPSHATGKARLVPPMALAAVACGADGVMVEVHNDPMHALCDGAQSLRPEQFAELAKKMLTVREALQ